MKLAGVIFILASAWSVGCRFSSSMKMRCDRVKFFLDALQILRNELAFLGTPLAEAYQHVAASSQGLWGSVFLDMARRMECDRWLAPTSAAEEALALVQGERICGIMIDLAAKLGSYDLDAQLRGIDGAVESAKSLLYELEAERKLRSKTYKTLSICTGAAVAILLI